MAEEITLKSFPFDSVNVLNEESGQMEPDREYEAEIFRRYFAKFLSNGVYFGDYKNYKENSMKVSTDGGLTIKVATGAGIIEGADFENEEERVFTLERPVSGERIDRVVVRFDKTLSQRNTYLLVKKGDGTTAPAIQRDDNIYEICIAEITINSTSNLSSDSIADTRLNKDLCGIVNSLITVDGEELYQRFEANIQKIEQEFQEYVDNTKENFTSREETYLKEETYNKTEIDGKVDAKAPTSHASSGTTYGVGTTSNYGHCKVANNLNNSSFADGVALAAYQGYLLLQEIKKKLNASGGTITGSIVPGTNNAFDLGSISKLFRTIYAKEFNGTNFYGTNLEVSYAEILNNLNVEGNIVSYNGNLDLQGQDGEANIYANNGAIKSAYTYDNETVSNTPNAYITSNGWFRRTTNTSSERYKTDITNEISDELNPEKLYDLEVKQFKYKEEYQPNKDDMRYNKNLIGFIAEDVAKIFPIASDYEKDENGNIRIENWNERYLIPAMLLLDQKHHKEIEELKAKDKEKDVIIQDLILRISRLEEKLEEKEV